ncbi:hypothetical protein F511_26745 [Dorcoceras hygrometricum]|uniref:Uncharacterized protein n=1 Tax=Dorcoceras hygrometricum TaxID=472368 RepID=A0A2Z7C3G2_9LAMI|nr:hypothetical protein F511_26745 [Dorcoceras hygrometricum]
MSDRVSCWYFSRCVLVGSSSNADVDFRRWYFSYDGQQRALRDSEATTFCEQEPAAAVASDHLLVSDQQWLASDVSYGDVSLSLCDVVLFSYSLFSDRTQLMQDFSSWLGILVVTTDFVDEICSCFCQLLRSVFNRRLGLRIALDSSREGASSYITFGRCSWLEAELRSNSNGRVLASFRRSLVLVLLGLVALVAVVLGQSSVASVEASIRRLSALVCRARVISVVSMGIS